LVCIIYVTDFHFHHYKPHIQFLFFCKYGTLNHIQGIVYLITFLIMFPLSHCFGSSSSFLGFLDHVSFLYLLALFSADLERCLSTISWYFPDVMANACRLRGGIGTALLYFCKDK
jgi:hypothetical protein